MVSIWYEQLLRYICLIASIYSLLLQGPVCDCFLTTIKLTCLYLQVSKANYTQIVVKSYNAGGVHSKKSPAPQVLYPTSF